MYRSENRSRPAAGLTLIELLVGLSIGASVLALSTPMANMLRENKAQSISYEFITALNLARSEAIKRGNPVTVCRTINGLRCEGDDDINGQKDWSQGWIVFSDINGNGQVNSTQDEILRVRQALGEGYTLRSNAKIRVTYKPIGVSPGFMDSWTVCTPGKNNSLAKGIVVAYTGRVRHAKDTNGDGIIDNGTPGNRRDPRNLICNVENS
jgi:type IV fimbrial biogenesis protein FimT